MNQETIDWIVSLLEARDRLLMLVESRHCFSTDADFEAAVTEVDVQFADVIQSTPLEAREALLR
jgi:hypothetical protein